jgi:glycosyltransferase involved in cell wall biosynthesis
MAGIIIVTPYLPYPTRSNGLSVRLAPVIDDLVTQRDVHLVVVGDRHVYQNEGLNAAKEKCASVSVIDLPLNPWSVRLGLLGCMFAMPTPPMRLLYHGTSQACAKVSSVMKHADCDTILSLGDMMSHTAVQTAKRYSKIRHVIDWVDSPALHAARTSTAAESKEMAHIDRIRGWERRVNRAVDKAIYISLTDAQSANDTLGERIAVVPNGLVDDFPIEREPKWREALNSVPKVTLGFLGNMGYEPNNLAAIRLCGEILPFLQTELGDLDFKVRVIGRNPSAELLAHRSEKIEITGAVDDIWQAMEDVDVFVFPMLQGAGMQNKVLEAIRSKRPVLASSLCINGLPPSPKLKAIPVDSPRETASAIASLLGSPQLVRSSVSDGMAYLAGLTSRESVRNYIQCL